MNNHGTEVLNTGKLCGTGVGRARQPGKICVLVWLHIFAVTKLITSRVMKRGGWKDGMGPHSADDEALSRVPSSGDSMQPSIAVRL